MSSSTSPKVMPANNPRLSGSDEEHVAEGAESSHGSSTGEKPSGHVTLKASKKQSRKSRPAKADYRYRKLLNTAVGEFVSGHDEEKQLLPPGQVDASFWTSQEKAQLFRKLSTTGPGEIHRLAAAIPTKSEPEIQAYLLLLREGAIEAEGVLALDDSFSFIEVPAAVEVDEDVDAAVDRAAAVLDRRVRTQQDAEEKTRHGDYWLMTQALAERLEADLAQSEGGAKRPSDEGTVSGDILETHDAAQVTPGVAQYDSSVDEKGDEDDHDDSNAKPAYASQVSVLDIALPIPAASLLRPSMFLELSRSCFMGSHPEYAELENEQPDSAPSMYRTAFDDMHNLTVSLTRRLVQATIFQTLTRLRAKDGLSPAPHVRVCDVEAATDILGMRVDRKAYWANMPRRCGVEVYTEAEKYVDGRTVTRQGAKVTLAEVEAELGVWNSESMDAASDGQSDHSEHDLHAYCNDSDAWTEVDASASSTPTHDHDLATAKGAVALEEDEKPQPDAATHTKPSRKRKRALSPRSHAKAEDAYLEVLDQRASEEGNRQLRELLRIPSPHAEIEENTLPKPPQPLSRAVVNNASSLGSGRPASSWRDAVEYEAPWEQVAGVPPSSAFARMERIGRKRRKGREGVERQLRMDTEGDDYGEGQSDSDRGTDSGDGFGEVDVNEGTELLRQGSLE